MYANENDRTVKARITHVWHGEKEMTLEGRIVLEAHNAYDHRKIFRLQHAGNLFMRFIPFFLLVLSTFLPAYAQGDIMEPASARIIAAYDGVGSFASHDMGLEITLNDPWYIYWKMPGEAGLAPVFVWSQSKNVKDVEVSWPAPKRFNALDLYSFGYDGTVILPLTVMPDKTGQDITLNLKLDLVVCHEICIPQTIQLSYTLSEKTAGKSADYKSLRQARQNLPSENNKLLYMDSAVLGKDSIVITAYAKGGFDSSADVFVDTSELVITSLPEILPQYKNNERVIIKLAVPEGVDLAKSLFGKSVSILLVNKGQAAKSEFTF
jgi:suppressor for copper-sensitivity B